MTSPDEALSRTFLGLEASSRHAEPGPGSAGGRPIIGSPAVQHLPLRLHRQRIWPHASTIGAIVSKYADHKNLAKARGKESLHGTRGTRRDHARSDLSLLSPTGRADTGQDGSLGRFIVKHCGPACAPQCCAERRDHWRKAVPYPMSRVETPETPRCRAKRCVRVEVFIVPTLLTALYV